MSGSESNRAAQKRIDRFVTTYSEDLLSIPKAQRFELLDLVNDNRSKEARKLLAQYVAQAKSLREVSASKAVVTRRENRVKRVIRAYRTVETNRPVDEERLKDNVRKNEDPEFNKLLNRVKDDRELGMELQYRAMIIGPDAKVLSGAFYHGRSAL